MLRLAHRLTHPRPAAPAHCRLRSCSDFCLIYQLAGRSWIWWEPAGGSLSLPAGHAVLFPPHAVHGLALDGAPHIAVHFDLEADPAMIQGGLGHIEPLDVLRQESELDHVPEVVLADGAIRHPLRVRAQGRREWERHLESLVAAHDQRGLQRPAQQLRSLERLGFLLRQFLDCERDGHQPGDLDPRLQRLLGDPDLRSGLAPSVADMAHRCELGVVAFRNLFTRELGQPPRAWLEARRIERAARLLIDSDEPIAVIAESVGYPDPYHFSRVFRRVTGAAPRDYRRRGSGAG